MERCPNHVSLLNLLKPFQPFHSARNSIIPDYRDEKRNWQCFFASRRRIPFVSSYCMTTWMVVYYSAEAVIVPSHDVHCQYWRGRINTSVPTEIRAMLMNYCLARPRPMSLNQADLCEKPRMSRTSTSKAVPLKYS